METTTLPALVVCPFGFSFQNLGALADYPRIFIPPLRDAPFKWNVGGNLGALPYGVGIFDIQPLQDSPFEWNSTDLGPVVNVTLLPPLHTSPFAASVCGDTPSPDPGPGPGPTPTPTPTEGILYPRSFC